MAITREQIFQAAEALQSQGQSPTLAAVRRNLGGGSFTTISEYMAEWRAQHQAASQPVRESAPSAVAEKLTNLGNEIWGSAMELANARLAAEREALEQHRAEIERRQIEITEMADQMAEEIEGLRARLAESENRAAEYDVEVRHLRVQAATWQGEAEKGQALVGEMSLRVEDLRAQLSAGAERISLLEGERPELLALREGKASFKAEAEKANALAAEVGKRVADLSRLMELSEKKNAEQIARGETERDRLRAELVATREEVGRIRGQLGSQESRAEDLRRQIEVIEKRAADQGAELVLSRQQLSEAREAAAVLRGRLEALKPEEPEGPQPEKPAKSSKRKKAE